MLKRQHLPQTTAPKQPQHHKLLTHLTDAEPTTEPTANTAPTGDQTN